MKVIAAPSLSAFQWLVSTEKWLEDRDSGENISKAK